MLKDIKINKQNAQEIFELAFGKILKLGSRETQDGDFETYEICKSIIEECSYYLN